MRLTVGPLPPAVYWRRRAVVLGAGLIFLLVLFYSFNGPDSGAAPKGGAAKSPSAQPKPTAVLTPETESPPPPSNNDPGLPVSSATGSAPAGIPPAPPPADGSCSDAEISVIPVPAPSSIRRGATVDLRLKIKNVSDRTCSRDVGADLQEIYIRLGAKLVWSSDTCNPTRSNDLESFTPNFEREYRVTWNGKDNSKCANGVANGPAPEAGEYQVFGRLGTKHSEPVKLTITG
jgi:hypothetical protein